ncbi:hypothetical protein BZA70DRAFT_265499 [Myxozyma melibiosi]|uniref:Peptidase S54 rhomboid domain-containing protein n=1 Tax=Myxozyma melibiosi TaxID=54550 RepID=A0ABR1FEM2_9ASCO
MTQSFASRPQLSKTLSPAVPSNQTRFYQHWYQKKSGWRYYKYQYYDRFNLPSENAIYALIATFVGVYALKSFVPGFPDLSYSKDKSFIYLFTSSFDHADLGHLFTNCFFIYFMGSMFPASISAATVFAIFTLGGAGGSFLFEMYSSYQARRALAKGNILRYNMEQRSRSCGASGGIFSLLALETLMAPFRPILFMGIVPMRSWVFFVGLVGLDFAQVVYKEIRSEQGYPPSGRQIGNGAHIGGAFMGHVFYNLGIMRLRSRTVRDELEEIDASNI